MDIFVYAFLFLNVIRVCDYIAAGLDGKIVDPDCGIHEYRLTLWTPRIYLKSPSTTPNCLRVRQP